MRWQEAFGLSVGELVHHPTTRPVSIAMSDRPVDRQAYRSCRPSSSRLPPRQTRPSNRLGGAALRCIPPSCERGTSSASRACTGCAWDTSWSNIPRPPQEAHFALRPERCNNAEPVPRRLVSASFENASRIRHRWRDSLKQSPGKPGAVHAMGITVTRVTCLPLSGSPCADTILRR